MAALALEEVKEFLKVDCDDEDTLIKNLMVVADNYLKGSIGANYNNEDERAKVLSLLIISDLYDNRNLSSNKEEINNRKIFDDMALQLKLELRP